MAKERWIVSGNRLVRIVKVMVVEADGPFEAAEKFRDGDGEPIDSQLRDVKGKQGDWKSIRSARGSQAGPYRAAQEQEGDSG